MAALSDPHRPHATSFTSILNSRPASPFPAAHRRLQTISTDTSYNGSGGDIGDSLLYNFDTTTQYDSSTALARNSLLSTRQPLSARLLSAVSNAQPAAAALTRKGSVLHTRAKSLAALVPKLNPPTERREQGVRIINDLFSGESAPIRLGPPVSPTKEIDDMEFIMEYRTQLTERPLSALRRKTAGATTKSSSTTSNATTSTAKPTSSWFTRRSTIQPLPVPSDAADELAHINIHNSLFPNGPADQLDPSSFNDLLLNATALLERMQSAYREKVVYIASIRPEIDAQKEEVEEAETRSQHLKIQLEDTSRRAQEQDALLKDLALQLAEEKMKVQTLQDEAARSVRLVCRPSASADSLDDSTSTRRKRTSAGSASDSGFESDIDAASVFSGASTSGVSQIIDVPLSPTISFTTMPTSIGPVETEWALPQPKSREVTKFTASRKPIPLRLGGNGSSSATAGTRLGSEGAAWATVEVLRSENADLKRMVEEMHGNLQACIDFVGGVVV